MEVKVDIFKNKMLVSGGGQSKTAIPEKPFTSTRLLVGNFQSAEICLNSALKEIGAIGLFKPKPKLTIIAKEMNEEGLSEVEEKVLLELGYAAGAGKVDVKSGLIG